MKLNERISGKIYNIATGSDKKRVILAPIVGSIFAIITALFVIIPVNAESYFNIPAVVIFPFNIILGLLLSLVGTFLMLWSCWYFFAGKRTPVPVNPPKNLITRGPYKYMRNPMHTGMFLVMFAFGFYYDSLLSVFLFTPLYIFIYIWYFKNVEEPELEKRLGKDYIEYKQKVPMFFPWGRKNKG